MIKKQHNQVLVILSAIMFSILLLLPFLFVLGWYILYYGGSMVLVYVFKLGLGILALTTLSFWFGVLGYAAHELKEEGY